MCIRDRRRTGRSSPRTPSTATSGRSSRAGFRAGTPPDTLRPAHIFRARFFATRAANIPTCLGSARKVARGVSSPSARTRHRRVKNPRRENPRRFGFLRGISSFFFSPAESSHANVARDAIPAAATNEPASGESPFLRRIFYFSPRAENIPRLAASIRSCPDARADPRADLLPLLTPGRITR